LLLLLSLSLSWWLLLLFFFVVVVVVVVVNGVAHAARTCFASRFEESHTTLLEPNTALHYFWGFGCYMRLSFSETSRVNDSAENVVFPTVLKKQSP